MRAATVLRTDCVWRRLPTSFPDGPTVVAHACAKLPTLKRLWVDGAYAGQCAQAVHAAHSTQVEVVHPAVSEAVPTGCVVLPKRRVVERTHAWNERCRRLDMHHDRSTLIVTARVWFAKAHILVSRLAV